MYHSSKSTDKVSLRAFTNSRCQQQIVDVAKRTPTHKTKSQKDLQEQNKIYSSLVLSHWGQVFKLYNSGRIKDSFHTQIYIYMYIHKSTLSKITFPESESQV